MNTQEIKEKKVEKNSNFIGLPDINQIEKVDDHYECSLLKAVSYNPAILVQHNIFMQDAYLRSRLADSFDEQDYEHITDALDKMLNEFMDVNYEDLYLITNYSFCSSDNSELKEFLSTKTKDKDYLADIFTKADDLVKGINEELKSNPSFFCGFVVKDYVSTRKILHKSKKRVQGAVVTLVMNIGYEIFSFDFVSVPKSRMDLPDELNGLWEDYAKLCRKLDELKHIAMEENN